MMDNILSTFQWGFRKGYSAQHCLLHKIDKIRKARDSKGALLLLLQISLKPFTVFLMSNC